MTAYVEWRGGEWQTRVTDRHTGKRKWIAIEKDADDKLTERQVKEAKQLAQVVQEIYASGAWVPNDRDLTLNEFFKRWNTWRSQGPLKNQAVDDARIWRLWIGDELGTLPFHALRRERLISFSGWLDARTREKNPPFGPKRARNIFACLAAMLRDAHESKNPSIRVLSENPCTDVPWPEDREGDPVKQQLFRDEFLALVSCPDVPLVRRRLYAVALYTQTRIGEVRVLRCEDVSVERRYVNIVKASDRKSKGATKKTKSDRSRRCTLEPTLAPLLFQMIAERGSGPLFPDRPEGMPKGNQHARQPVLYIPGTSKACEVFRRDLRLALEVAGLAIRTDLFDDSDTEISLPIRFHDLRATGVTWRHARGDRPAVIRQECGHENESTNEIYIRELRDLRPEDVFPPLPPELLGSGPTTAQWAARPAVFPSKTVPEEGVEPSPLRRETQPNAASSRETPLPVGPKDDVSKQIRAAVAAALSAGDDELAARLLEVLRAAKEKPPVAAKATGGQVLPFGKRR